MVSREAAQLFSWEGSGRNEVHPAPQDSKQAYGWESEQSAFTRSHPICHKDPRHSKRSSWSLLGKLRSHRFKKNSGTTSQWQPPRGHCIFDLFITYATLFIFPVMTDSWKLSGKSLMIHFMANNDKESKQNKQRPLPSQPAGLSETWDREVGMGNMREAGSWWSPERGRKKVLSKAKRRLSTQAWDQDPQEANGPSLGGTTLCSAWAWYKSWQMWAALIIIA